MARSLLLLLLAAVTAVPVVGGEPSAIEDSNFMPETAWNRSDAVLQYTTFFLGRAASHEVTQEWAASSPRHQLSYTIPFYSERVTGLGDAAVNYRYQLVGSEESRLAIAPRVSVILPTRSSRFGEKSSGLQVNVPISTTLGGRVASHTNIGASWYADRPQRELNLSQQVAIAVSNQVTVTMDAAYTAGSGSRMIVVRPGAQVAFDLGGLQVAPGIAFPRGGGSEGVLLFVSFARQLRASN